MRTPGKVQWIYFTPITLLPQRRCSHLLLPLFLILCSLNSPACSLYFDLSESKVLSENCSPGKKAICLQGDAIFQDGVIQLTMTQPIPNKFSAGRAYYSEPLHLWDNSTGKLANFTTSFFVDIHYHNASARGNGMAAFFSPYPYQIPPDSKGQYLGLISYGHETTTLGLVAVELDVYPSPAFSDPEYPHIGIDINSLTSLITRKLYWNGSDISGTATISYDANTFSFSVHFVDANDQSHPIALSHIIDLRDVLPQWVTLGFSATTHWEYFENNRILSWKFGSTLEDEATMDTASGNIRKQSRVRLLTGIAGGVAGLMIMATVSLFLFGLWKRKNIRKAAVEESTAEPHALAPGHGFTGEEFEGIGPERFSYCDLVAATESFSEARKLGVGGFGAVYRGFLQGNNRDVAIKKLSRDSKQGPKEYASELKVISQLRHKNLVQLIGCCHEGDVLLLVYELMPNSSLDYYLFGKKQPMLPWSARYHIAKGLASALVYLHGGWNQCVVHRDIKSSNVMLDSDFNAKLGDFGLARLVNHGSSMRTTVLAGTYGYMAPECLSTGKCNKESDVYSFGVVLLEIACGRRAIERTEATNKVMLVEWVWGLYEKDELLTAADPRMNGQFDDEQMRRLILVGLWCVNPYMDARPTMEQAIAALNFDIDPTPILPRKMPMSFYSTSSTTTTATASAQCSSAN